MVAGAEGTEEVEVTAEVADALAIKAAPEVDAVEAEEGGAMAPRSRLRRSSARGSLLVCASIVEVLTTGQVTAL